MMELVVKRGRTRRRHDEQLKLELVNQCSKPSMSLASVARQQGLHPNLLSRWVKERQPVNGLPDRKALPLPQFVPVRIDFDQDDHVRSAWQSAPRVEVNIDRAEL